MFGPSQDLQPAYLAKGGGCMQSKPPPGYSARCRKGHQGIELIMNLRRVARIAYDGGLEFYIAKLDIRKAFDSIYHRKPGPARLGESRQHMQAQ